MTCGGTNWHILHNVTWLNRFSAFWKILQGINKNLEKHWWNQTQKWSKWGCQLSVSHRALQVYHEGRAGPTWAPQNCTKINLNINGEPQHTTAHFSEGNLWLYPKELPQSCLRHSGERSVPYSTETALAALGTTNCAAADAAVLGVLKKHERNICSWHSSCNINLKRLLLGNDKTLTALQPSIFAGRTGTSCVHMICQLMISRVGWKWNTHSQERVVSGQGYSLVGLEDKNPGERKLPLKDSLCMKSSGFAVPTLQREGGWRKMCCSLSIYWWTGASASGLGCPRSWAARCQAV